MSLTVHQIPHSAYEAQGLLAHRHERKISKNGWLFRTNGGDAYALKLHNTIIVVYNSDGTLTINTGGWNTVTTRAWINQALRGTGFRVFTRKRVLCVDRWPQYMGDRGPAVRTWDGSPLTLDSASEALWQKAEM